MRAELRTRKRPQALITLIALLTGVGFGATAFTTAVRARLMNESPDAPSLTTAMNRAAFNFANALGAIAGSTLIDSVIGCRASALAGTILTVFGLAFTLVTIISKRRSPHCSRSPVEV